MRWLVIGALLFAIGLYGIFSPVRDVKGGLVLLVVGGYLFLTNFGALRRKQVNAGASTQAELTPERREKLRRNVATLRSAGFFAKHAGKNDKEVEDLLIARYNETWGGSLTELIRDPTILMRLDPSRALEYDTEMDPLPGDSEYGDKGYTDFLHALADISQGTLNPESIEETMSADKKHVELSFNAGGQRRHLRLRYNNDWMDPKLFPTLCEFTSNNPRQLVIPPGEYGQEFVVICINDAEREILRTELNLKL